MHDLVLNLKTSNGAGTYSTVDNFYWIEPGFITAETRAFVASVPGTIIWPFAHTPNADVKGYYVAVDDLDNELDASLPSSSVEDEEGNVRQLTYGETITRSGTPPSNNPPVREDGLWYFLATAHIDHRDLTLAEYNAITVPLIYIDDLPALPVVDDAV